MSRGPIRAPSDLLTEILGQIGYLSGEKARSCSGLGQGLGRFLKIGSKIDAIFDRFLAKIGSKSVKNRSIFEPVSKFGEESGRFLAGFGQILVDPRPGPGQEAASSLLR